MALRLIAIGDLHGEVTLLTGLLSDLNLTHEDRLIFLGDYVDRGENTPQTVEVLRLAATQVHCIFLRGNHEDMLLDYALQQKRYLAGTWEQNGGAKTLLQYKGQIPFEHLAFLACTLPIYNVGPYVFVHAGLDPNKTIPEQTPHDLMWIREPWLSTGTVKDFDGFVIHGHTPEPDPEKIRVGNRLNLDAGAFQTGVLRAAIINPQTGAFDVVHVTKDENDEIETAEVAA